MHSLWSSGHWLALGVHNWIDSESQLWTLEGMMMNGVFTECTPCYFWQIPRLPSHATTQPRRKLEIVGNLYRHIDYLENHKLCTDTLLKPSKVEHPNDLRLCCGPKLSMARAGWGPGTCFASRPFRVLMRWNEVNLMVNHPQLRFILGYLPFRKIYIILDIKPIDD